jgi:hypothetical protein
MAGGHLDEYHRTLDAAVKRYRAAAGAAAKAEANPPEPRRKGEAIDISEAIEPNRELDEAALRFVAR